MKKCRAMCHKDQWWTKYTNWTLEIKYRYPNKILLKQKYKDFNITSNYWIFNLVQ